MDVTYSEGFCVLAEIPTIYHEKFQWTVICMTSAWLVDITAIIQRLNPN